MNYNELFTSVNAGKIGTRYVFEGTEEYLKQQAVARICEKLLPTGLEQMNLTELTNPDADALIAAAETLPFMADMRVVLVRDCDLLTASKRADDVKLDALVDYLPKQSPTTCLIFIVKGKADARKKLYTTLKKLDASALVDFSPMNDADAVKWTIKNMRQLGKQMDAQTAQKLIFTVGKDAATLKQEIDKLAHFAGDDDTVSDDAIDAVCTKSLECTVFQMIDAQVTGRNDEAFKLMQSMIRGGEDRFGILAMLLRQYRILYHMRCLLDERAPQQTQAGLLGISPYAVARTQSQARRYSKERLKAAYDYLFALEYRLKSGQTSQEGSAEAAMLQLIGILTAEDGEALARDAE